ncbi:MAG: TolC family protein [Planctomycetes bacterium]|nr:TolC family protein [Planctomycetota bacterium]
MRRVWVALALTAGVLLAGEVTEATASTPLSGAEGTAASLAPSPAALSAPQAIALALFRHETPAIAAARIRAAEAQRQRAAAALRPSVRLQGSLSTSDRDEVPHGGDAHETAAWGAAAEIALLRASAWSGLAAARYALQAQQLEGAEMRRALAYSVAALYLDALAAERQVVAAENRLAVARAAVADAQARLDAGLAVRTDVIRAELEAATAQLALTRARNYTANLRLALEDLIVQPLGGALAEPPTIEIPDPAIDTLHRLALYYRGDLKALQLREAAAEQRRRAGYGRWVPDVVARAEASAYDTNDPLRAAGDKTTVVTLSLVATWTLYDGGDREGAIAEAEAQRRELGLERTRQLRALRKDLQTALADLGTAEAALQQAEARARLARANADEVRARYKQGLATALEDADAISARFEADSGLVAAQLALSRARLQVRRLVGLWPFSEREPLNAP